MISYGFDFVIGIIFSLLYIIFSVVYFLTLG